MAKVEAITTSGIRDSRMQNLRQFSLYCADPSLPWPCPWGRGPPSILPPWESRLSHTTGTLPGTPGQGLGYRRLQVLIFSSCTVISYCTEGALRSFYLDIKIRAKFSLVCCWCKWSMSVLGKSKVLGKCLVCPACSKRRKWLNTVRFLEEHLKRRTRSC